ncbi:MAG: histone deacetylase [Proteobacteria bacterium]|nr:histone deacetylase [Pseudomonadota bacterium]
MRVAYSPGYVVPLPEGHRFPMPKFALLHERLLAEGLLRAEQVVEPSPAAWTDLERVHDRVYLENFRRGALDRGALRRLGLPWSEALVRRSRLAVQGTLEAVRMAQADGIAANLAGGTHHAFPDRGEGFCVFNDVAVAIRAARAQGRLRRALVVDLDVHQGNGTAAVFAGDPETYTFSVHGARNYPFRKLRSSRDVALPDGTGDSDYLQQLESHLPFVLEEARADVAIYVAGVDPVRGDRFGRLALSRGGLARRERYVLRTLRAAELPVAIVMGGGYAATPELTADLHAEVHREARRLVQAP